MTDMAQAGMQSLTEDDQRLVREVATLLVDVVEPFGPALAEHVHRQVSELPDDEKAVEATRKAAVGNPRELLSMMRANLPISAHETPTEAIQHVRFLRGRGIGFRAVNELYQYGFSMFRHVMLSAFQDRVESEDQAQRIGQVLDEYSFAFVGKLTMRFAAEFGLTEGGWEPTPEDDAIRDPVNEEAARKFRRDLEADGAWLASSVEESKARAESERALRDFTETLRGGADAENLHARLRLAESIIGITLADEPDLSITVQLDRDPIEIVDGLEGCEARMWIASVDLNRMWKSDFYLPMAVAKERVQIEGPIRKFLRIAPILRVLDEYHESLEAKA